MLCCSFCVVSRLFLGIFYCQIFVVKSGVVMVWYWCCYQDAEMDVGVIMVLVIQLEIYIYIFLYTHY